MCVTCSAELETKRILLDIFKEKQQKSAEAGTIRSFYKKKPKDGSISHKVQRLAKYRFLKKQSDLLLNADDLDAMWVCLRENCVIDDAMGAEKLQGSLFQYPMIMLISLSLTFCRCTMKTFAILRLSLTQARIDMSELDEDSDGFLQHHVSAN
ncbi:probable serine/threonine-protein phosphatase 2A regulatory subunit B'' subunit TON2 [Tanacetum coccineum]